VWAVLIGLTLAYLALELDTKLRNNSKSGAVLIIVIYLFVASFSFVANFNYFYSSTIKEQLVNEHLDEIHNKLVSLRSVSFNATNKFPDKIKKLKITIYYQLLDKANPDWGPKTQLIADTLNKYLGVEITKPSGSPKQKAISVAQQIDALLDTRMSVITDFKNSVNAKISKFESDLKNIKKSENINVGRVVLSEGTNMHNDICNEALNFVGDLSIFDCKIVQSYKDEEVGQIQHSIKTALDRPKDAVVPFFQSAFLDLLLPFLIIISSASKYKKIDPKFPDRRIR